MAPGIGRATDADGRITFRSGFAAPAQGWGSGESTLTLEM